MQQKLITIFLIIVSLCAGIFIGTKIAYTTTPEKNVDSTYNAGWIAAIKTLSETGAVPSFPAAEGLKNFTGSVQAVAGNSLTVKVSNLEMMGTPELVMRTVNIDSNTQIFQFVQRDPAQLKKEFDAFNEKMIKFQGEKPAGNHSDLPVPPQTQEQKTATVADLKPGLMITIQTAEDIKDKKQFTATQIQFQAQAPIPQVPLVPKADEIKLPEANEPAVKQ